MPLTYDITQCERIADLQYEDDHGWRLYPFAQNVVFLTMAVGIGHITEDNYLEFYARANIVERLERVSREQWTTPNHIKMMIGLRTNVQSETWRQWLHRWMDYEKKEVIWNAKKSLS